jgi:hypothetical protein
MTQRSLAARDGAKDRQDYTTIILRPVQLSMKGSRPGNRRFALVSCFEKGSLSRRELVRDLAMLAAGGTAAAAQEGLDFKDANIDHVSIHVADLQRSVDFYQRMFGFSVVSQDQAGGIIRLGNTEVLVSQPWRPCRHCGPLCHRSCAIRQESTARYLTQRGANPGRLCRFAHQGSRRDERTKFSEGMSSEWAA